VNEGAAGDDASVKDGSVSSGEAAPVVYKRNAAQWRKQVEEWIEAVKDNEIYNGWQGWEEYMRRRVKEGFLFDQYDMRRKSGRGVVMWKGVCCKQGGRRQSIDLHSNLGKRSLCLVSKMPSGSV
jgi:hypothetical protein